MLPGTLHANYHWQLEQTVQSFNKQNKRFNDLTTAVFMETATFKNYTEMLFFFIAITLYRLKYIISYWY